MTSHQPPHEQQTPMTGAVNALTEATTGAESRVTTLTRGLPTVAIWNRSTVVTDADIATAAAALQIQVTRDFYPAWGINAVIIAVPKAQTPPRGAWVITVGDDTTTPNALGWHDVTDANLPRAVVWARTDQQHGLSYTVTISHELLEMLLDPYAVSCVFDQASDTTGRIVPYEACDAVEADAAGYTINGVQVSDFILPAWFDSSLAPNSTKFDFMGHLTAPLSLMHGGYMSVCTVTASSGWSSINAEGIVGKPADYAEDPRHRR